MQRFSSFFILLTLFLLVAPVTHGKFNPTDVPNNKYGIHIVEPNDIIEVSTLVNSSGGDWGYVTLVIQEDDRNKEKWQAIFNTMRRMHLIPIVRLATKIEADAWKKTDRRISEGLGVISQFITLADRKSIRCPF